MIVLLILILLIIELQVSLSLSGRVTWLRSDPLFWHDDFLLKHCNFLLQKLFILRHSILDDLMLIKNLYLLILWGELWDIFITQECFMFPLSISLIDDLVFFDHLNFSSIRLNNIWDIQVLIDIMVSEINLGLNFIQIWSWVISTCNNIVLIFL